MVSLTARPLMRDEGISAVATCLALYLYFFFFFSSSRVVYFSLGLWLLLLSLRGCLLWR